MNVVENSKGKFFKFRDIDENTLLWIHSEFATKQQINGLDNLISYLLSDNNEIAFNALYHICDYLCDDNFDSPVHFSESFGKSYKDCRILFEFMNSNLGSDDPLKSKLIQNTITINDLEIKNDKLNKECILLKKELEKQKTKILSLQQELKD